MIKFRSLFSSSSGNCAFISSGKTKILVDIGVYCKNIENGLCAIDEEAKDIKAIFITHEHSDHIKGAEVFSRKYDTPIYATEETWLKMRLLSEKISGYNIKIIEKDIIEPIGDIGVRAFEIPHDAIDPVGYSFFIGEKKITTATDVGHISGELEMNLAGSHAVLLESNHDISMLKSGTYPYHLKQRILSDYGHLSNDNCARLALKLVKRGTYNLILGHLSAENNRPDIAYNTTCNVFESAGIKVGHDVIMSVASKNFCGEEVLIS